MRDYRADLDAAQTPAEGRDVAEAYLEAIEELGIDASLERRCPDTVTSGKRQQWLHARLRP